MSLLVVVMVLEVVSLRLPAIEFQGKLITLEDKTDQLMVAFQMMLAFYFGSKVLHHITSADARKSKELASAVASAGPQTASQKPREEEFEESGTVG
jgi:hypothetical protein